MKVAAMTTCFILLKPLAVSCATYSYGFKYYVEGDFKDPCTEKDHEIISETIENDVSAQVVQDGDSPIKGWAKIHGARVLRGARDLQCTCGNLNCVIHYQICRVYCASTCSRRVLETSLELDDSAKMLLARKLSTLCVNEVRRASRTNTITQECAKVLTFGKCDTSVGEVVYEYGTKL